MIRNFFLLFALSFSMTLVKWEFKSANKSSSLAEEVASVSSETLGPSTSGFSDASSGAVTEI